MLVFSYTPMTLGTRRSITIKHFITRLYLIKFTLGKN